MNKEIRKNASRAGRVAATAAKAAARAGVAAAAVAGAREFRKGVAKQRRATKLKTAGKFAAIAGAVVVAGLAAKKYM